MVILPSEEKIFKGLGQKNREIVEEEDSRSKAERRRLQKVSATGEKDKEGKRKRSSKNKNRATTAKCRNHVRSYKPTNMNIIVVQSL